MPSHRPHVLALDLEGTLISNAMSQIPRPGLFAFLARCRELFERVVMFTTVDEARFRVIAQALVDDGLAPGWFAQIEVVHWHGPTKDLGFITAIRPEEALLVDDFEVFVHPGQEGQWVPVRFFDHPYPAGDTGLAEVLPALERRVGAA